MSSHRQFVDAEVIILSSEEGGRTTPLSANAYQGQYRPHIVIQPRQIRQARIEMRDGMRHITDAYLGIAFWSGADPIPVSTPFTLTMLLMHASHAAYDQIVPGTEFAIREGAKIIGHGIVLGRREDANP